jgi:hypothetical protein
MLAVFAVSAMIYRCPMVKRRPGSDPGNSTVYRPANLTSQLWMVDPEYYWFQMCECEAVSVTSG